MKTYTNEQRDKILYALQTSETAAEAVIQLYGVLDGDAYKGKITEFKRDCDRLGFGNVYRAKYRPGRRQKR